jgi:pimeloyl-ACP methyl ester carboxylesterase
MLSPSEILFCAKKNLEAYDRPRPWCFVGPDNTLYVVVKGTANESDIWRDLRANLVVQGDWRVHAGFKSVYDDIIHAVQTSTLLSGITRIVVTGHSLGAAVALPVAYKLKEGLDVYGVTVEVCTFANPRYGNKRFCDDFDAAFPNAVWIQHDRDIIPHLPSTWFNWNKVFGYRHTHGRRWLTDNGSEEPSPRGLLRWLKFWIGWRPKDLTNHRMPTYIACVTAAQTRWTRELEHADTDILPAFRDHSGTANR